MKNSMAVAWLVLVSLVLTSFAFAEPVTFRVLHVNDFHGFAEPYTPYGTDVPVGGIAWLAAKAEALRQERPSLLLAAGDMSQGHNWVNLSQGKSAIELLNLMGFDAMVMGNHEFDFGQRVLSERLAEARFPVLAANVEGLTGLAPYVLREVGGVRVAIVGVVADDTPVATHPRNVSGLRFLSSADVLAGQIPELRKRAEVVIVLSHMGYAADRTLAEQVPGIDLIVGGHSHTKLEQPTRLGGTVIVQAWEHAKALGVVDITVDAGRVTAIDGRLEEIRPAPGAPQPAVQALVANYQKEVDKVLEGEAGVSAVALDGENVRRSETNLGDLVADIARATAGADAAIFNGGGIRASIAAGPIRVKDVYTALPFDNYLVAVRLTGAQIRRTLEHGVAGVEIGAGAFPQVSGLAFTYDPAAPAGMRVREVAINGEPLDPAREYAVATNDFLAAGGDGFTAFGDAVKSSRDFAVVGGALKGEKLVYCDAGRWLRDVVIDWLREQGTIAPTVAGRIRVSR